jgi:DNA-binding response OmpR family regulator
MATVVLVEDDQPLRSAMSWALKMHGHVVHAVGSAFEALRDIARIDPELVVLDLGLPDLDGRTMLRMLRSVSDVPVIIATARDDELTMVNLLAAGADDYIVKPFTSENLNARIAAILRRHRKAAEAQDQIAVGELRIDRRQRWVRLGSADLDLTRREFDMLAFLADRAGTVVSRSELIKAVWRHSYASTDQTLNVYVSGLRKKLGESAAAPRYLHTVRGVGLKLVPPAA